MFVRVLITCGLEMCLMTCLGGLTTDDKPEAHEGIIVKVEEWKLTMTDKDGKNEHSHDVARDAKISCDGKECKLADLQKGYKVKVTTEMRDNKRIATVLDAMKGSTATPLRNDFARLQFTSPSAP